MFAAGNVVRFTVKQVYDTQECLNVFYYKMNDPFTTSITPAQLGEVFWNKVQDNWRECTNSNVFYDRVIVENLDGTLDYGEYVIPVGESTGDTTGVPLPPFIAYSIQLNRTSRLTRHGWKRIVGVREDDITTFGEITAGMFAQVQELADDFADDLVVGLVTYCNPVIVGFPNDDRAERVEVPIDTATAKPIVTTQNSRKRGHGS